MGKRGKGRGNLSEERHFPPFPNPAGLSPFPKVPALGSGIGCGFPSPQHGENTAFFPVFRWRPNGCGSLLAIPLECGESLSHFPRSYLIESRRIPVSFGLGRNIGKRVPSALAGRPFFCRGRRCAAPPFPWGRDRFVPNRPTLFAWAGGPQRSLFFSYCGPMTFIYSTAEKNSMIRPRMNAWSKLDISAMSPPRSTAAPMPTSHAMR